MIHNFKNMFDGDLIKHFNIRNGIYHLNNEPNEIKDKYSNDLQKELIIWINKEFEANELFKSNNWKPFRDQDILTYMFFGYRKMFQFKQYYFQLTLDTNCDTYESCEYCKNKTNLIHFKLALWGWKEDGKENLQPDNIISILSDNIMPDHYWKRK